MKKILKTWLAIAVSIIAVTFIIYWLFYGNRRYIFPVEIGKLELSNEVRAHVIIDFPPEGALQLLDRIEQEQGYRYIIQYDGWSLLGEQLMEYFGSDGRYGEDNGNVLYLYRVRKKIGWPYDGEI